VACALIAILAGCGSQASSNVGRAKDYSGTTAYVRAREAFLQSARAGLAAGQAPMAALVAHVGASCPGSLRGTPADNPTVRGSSGSGAGLRTQLAATAFFLGLEQSLEVAQRQPLAAATQRFEATVAAIRWSDPRINNLMQTFAQITSQEHRRTEPDVCREISQWLSSGYRTLPALTQPELRGAIGRRWMREMAALGCGRFSSANSTSVLSALSLYEPPGVRPTVREVAASEQRLQIEEHHARAHAAQALGRALGIDVALPQRASSREGSKRSRVNEAQNAGRLSRCTGKPELVSETVKEPADAESEPVGR
jgi:hypothetical protein